MKRSFIFSIIACLCISSVCCGQENSEFIQAKTIKTSPGITFFLAIPESKDPLSPYYTPPCKVFDLDKSNERLFQKKMTDIFKGLGFWIAQSEALKAISKQFPDLITRSVRARDAFNRNFSPAILQIFYTLEGASKGELTFQKLKDSVLEEMKKSVDTNPEYKAMFPWLFGMEMDRDAAENFISTVESRAKLDSDLEGLVSLLLFHPAAIGNPAGLVSGDFLRKYDFSEHPKAKGLHGWVRYPAHWQMVEGNMPSVVVRFVSPRDGAMFFINVVNLPEEANDDDLKSLFNDDGALASFASNGKITEKRIVDLVGQKAIEFRTNIVNDTPLTKLYMQNIVYLTCYKTWLLIINGVVVTMNDEDCKTGMQNNLPLLQYLATMCGINRH